MTTTVLPSFNTTPRTPLPMGIQAPMPRAQGEHAQEGGSPAPSRREFTQWEQREIETGLSQWRPQGYDYGTPLTKTLASPLKAAFIVAAPFTLLAIGAGYYRNMWVALLSLGAGLGGAIGFSLSRKHKNANTLEVMHHLPPGARIWDYKNDPVIAKDEERQFCLVTEGLKWILESVGVTAASIGSVKAMGRFAAQAVH